MPGVHGHATRMWYVFIPDDREVWSVLRWSALLSVAVALRCEEREFIAVVFTENSSLIRLARGGMTQCARDFWCSETVSCGRFEVHDNHLVLNLLPCHTQGNDQCLSHVSHWLSTNICVTKMGQVEFLVAQMMNISNILCAAITNNATTVMADPYWHLTCFRQCILCSVLLCFALFCGIRC